ncbi:MAG TPA: hypothetical protein VFG68_17155 [Fimbriiglobus sp.]|nr:hypothetical protein [Fimbriiglobus sp.]
MRWKAVVCAAGLGPLAGCNVAYYAGYNLVNESRQALDEHRLSKRLRAEARAAWQEVCRQYPGSAFTDEFRDGFTDGYFDYLDVGHIPQPPAVPPPRYRRNAYLSPEGHALIKDYFAGFKYGADVAAATGGREFLTIPVLLPDPKPEPPLDIRIPAPPGAAPPEAAPAPAPLPSPVVPPPVVPGLGNPQPPKPDGAIPPKPNIPPPDPPKGDRPEPVSARAEPTAPAVTPPPTLPAWPDRPPPARPSVARPPAAEPAAPNPAK